MGKLKTNTNCDFADVELLNQRYYKTNFAICSRSGVYYMATQIHVS